MKSVIISLHNGLGDIIMTFPFLFELLKSGYDVTFETTKDKMEWLQYMVPELKVKELLVIDVYSDCRTFEPGFDILINLNRMMFCNTAAYVLNDQIAMKLNQQVLLAMLFNLHGLPFPTELSPSAYIHKEKHPTDKILVFAKSKKYNRTVSKEILIELEKICDNKRIFLNPQYENYIKFTEEVNNAKFVLSVDTGALHLAEALSTKWFGLFTNMGGYTRTKYYKHGSYIQSNVVCSPCNSHGRIPHGGDDVCKLDNQNQYTCVSGFDVNFIINKVYENL
jgi:ADP-heptose:LPS heptosyltransferase